MVQFLYSQKLQLSIKSSMLLRNTKITKIFTCEINFQKYDYLKKPKIQKTKRERNIDKNNTPR